MIYYNKEIETLPLIQLRQLQNKRLQKLVARVYHKVPFYKNMFDRKGIKPSDIKGVQDLHKIPFTKKKDLRNNYPFDLFGVDMKKILRIHASSGTTGKPTVVGYNRKDLKIFDEVVARSLVAGGARPGMKIHNAYGYGLFTGGLGIHSGATTLGLAVIPVSGGMTDRQLMIMQDFKPEILCCTPSYAQTLGEEMLKRGITHDQINLKYAILGAEPWTASIRAQVEKLLNVTATNIYGLSEIIGPGVSQEDFEEKGTGSYIWEDHFYPEIVDQYTGEPLPYEEEGVLVFTTLTKQAMPLLRYWTSDICHIYYDKGAKRTHIKMKGIRGRSDDMLIIRGVNFFHTQVEALLEHMDHLTPNYQINVTREGTLDKVKLDIEVSINLAAQMKSDPIISNEIITKVTNDLSRKIKQNIGLSMEVQIRDYGTIPRSEGGKLKRVIDHR